jgi:hypothetical protein
LRACIFIDGENFRHSIVELFTTFRREDYLPKEADWTGLFDWIVEKAAGGNDRIRTYWYVIQSVDYFPFGFSRLGRNHADETMQTKPCRRNHADAYNVLSRHSPFKLRLDEVSEADRPPVINAILKELRERQAVLERRFDGHIVMQDGIASKHTAIEFRRAGAIRYDLFTDSLGQEKAVGVKLATDLIVLRDIYDTAIILSGDQDYVPAVQVVKDSDKRVVNVAFRARSGSPLPGGSVG